MTTVMNVRLDEETRSALEALAREMDRPKAHLAQKAIKEYVQRQSWQIARIREGIRQLDEGDSFDLDNVMADLDQIIEQREG